MFKSCAAVRQAHDGGVLSLSKGTAGAGACKSLFAGVSMLSVLYFTPGSPGVISASASWAMKEGPPDESHVDRS